MTDPSDSPLDDDAFLAAFLDTLIPPGETMPAASAVGLVASIRKQLAENAMLAAPAAAALSAVRDAALQRDPGGLPALDAAAREELLKGLMPQQPVLGMFQMFVFAGYYQQPDVQKALGLPGKPPFPGGHEIEPTDSDLIARLEARKR
jgi:hypothetical protein